MGGCAKCGVPTGKNHKQATCEEPYKNFDKQPCDECLAYDHEAEECNSLIGSVCKACGHGDHKTPKCSIVTGGVVPDNLSEELLNQFTPRYRQKYLDSQATKASRSSNAPTSPASSSQRQALLNSPQKSPQRSPHGSQSIVETVEGLSIEDQIADRRKKWEEAEKKYYLKKSNRRWVRFKIRKVPEPSRPIFRNPAQHVSETVLVRHNYRRFAELNDQCLHSGTRRGQA